jgi:hypothetical protein
MLGHVENFWVKGILEKSLHGAALLELGIKEDPDAIKTYPWAIKRETTKETLPAGMSMLEIFEQIGMGRSLLILGAPGSGKTTMLLELTRQLIEHAREDLHKVIDGERQYAIEPIPVVFNLSSWSEKFTLADWLARELNVIYTIPKKIAPTWVKENKMLLLLDGLDEVKQESRDKCVDAINQFRKENGLTSMAVCSRIQDYAELKAYLSFEGAIEIQPMTSQQVNDYFKRFGKGLEGIRQVLEKDTILREMAETPLFLSVMTLAYRDTHSKDILISENLCQQREDLFNTYIERMFERPRPNIINFEKQDVVRQLSWLACNMIDNDAVPYLREDMRPNWLGQRGRWACNLMSALIVGLIGGLIGTLIGRLINGRIIGWIAGGAMGLIGGLICGIIESEKIVTVPLSWKQGRNRLSYGTGISIFLLIIQLALGPIFGLFVGLLAMLSFGVSSAMIFMTEVWQTVDLVGRTTGAKHRLSFLIGRLLTGFLLRTLVTIGGLVVGLIGGLVGLSFGFICGFIAAPIFNSVAFIQYYTLRFVAASSNTLPWRLVPFLNYCAERIVLRKVGPGYIFVHRLLMEHFAGRPQSMSFRP